MVAYQQQQMFRRDKNMCGKNLSGRFEDWMFKECQIKKQSIYNYKNLYKLMRIAPKLLNCRVNMTCLLTAMIFFLFIFKKTKSRHRGSITFTVIVKLLTHTLQNILRHFKVVLSKYILALKKSDSLIRVCKINIV